MSEAQARRILGVADITKHYGAATMADTAACHGCEEQTPLVLLDAKDDGSGNYTILQCSPCYGPDWLPV